MTKEKEKANNKNIIITLGQRIRQYRNASGLSGKNAANAIGVSEREYMAYERGEKCMTLSTAMKLCGLYHTALSTLLGFDRTNEKKKHDFSILTLKIARKQMAFTQTEAAEEIGVSRGTLSMYEKGTVDIPVTSFIRLVRLLKLDVYEINVLAMKITDKRFNRLIKN